MNIRAIGTASPFAYKYPCRREHLDTEILIINNIDISIWPHCYALRVIEPSVASSQSAPCSEENPCRSEILDTVVPLIGGVNVSTRSDGHITNTIELAIF